VRVYSQQELDRMTRSQLITLIKELNVEIEECHMLLEEALGEINSNDQRSS